jgi:hypothetical protein
MTEKKIIHTIIVEDEEPARELTIITLIKSIGEGTALIED